MIGDAMEQEFETRRRRLFGLAYRMLGDATEAEDVVQEAWLRLRTADGEIRDPGAWLTSVTTRLCLDRLRSARVRRERYVGPWLPEPIPTGPTVDPETISLSFLLLLEALSPLERAALLLHDVFDYPHDEVGALLGRDAAASRQLLHRAREHLAARKPRFQGTREHHQRLLGAFVAACASGDLPALTRMLVDDAQVVSDGGGVTRAARKVVLGGDRSARFLIGITRKGDPATIGMRLLELNGAPALALLDGDRVVTVVQLVLEDEDRIAAVHVVVNPEKLRGAQRLIDSSNAGGGAGSA